MGIKDHTEDIILADPPQEPGMGDELKTLIQKVRERGDCDVVVDFSNVSIITSSSVMTLLRLRKLVVDSGHRIVFCSLGSATRGVIFIDTDLEKMFEITDNKRVALASLQKVT